ncbi:NAD-dependent epimerase [Pyruvatibacter sp.]|uniref:NAD-dependent epimerase n=1 Tax=Pyruvatibacter sp. TaxID=1981328 RepID=UPI0032EC0D9D
MRILITGAAGFIGFHTAQALLARGDQVVGVDNLNHYYDVSLKNARLDILRQNPNFTFFKADISDKAEIHTVYEASPIDRVIHLAAQAGVRYAFENPDAYITSNILGFQNVIDCAKDVGVGHFVYASTSSVYGANTNMPFSASRSADHPVSLYAATKRSNELIAHTYAHLFGLPCTGLRFFTVYGPWGRPDMALFSFVRDILADKPIDIFNEGKHKRDFTYVDDIVDGIVRVTDRPASVNPDWSGDMPDPASSAAPWRIYNIGNNTPVALMDFVSCIEDAVGRKATKNFLPMQPGDVAETYADIDPVSKDMGFKPQTGIQEGIRKFVSWYLSYFKH